MKAHFGAIVFFALAAIAMTWPLAVNLPLAAAHPGDPYITSWMLDWAFHALTNHPSRLFNANIFHPLELTFAFSENLLGIVIVLSPLLAMKVPLLLLHNLAILIGFASAGYAAALLGRYLTGSMLAGMVGGCFFAFVPWRFTHLTHLQHLWTLWLPLLILAVLRLRDRPTRGRAAVLALCFVMNGLTNLHWLAFGSLAAVVCVLLIGNQRRFFALATAAMLVGTIALAPMLYPYWLAKQTYKMRGDAAETLQYSTRASDWLIASLHNRTYGPRLNDGTVDPERWSFPGILAPLLAVVGIATSFRRTPRHVAIGIALVALGFLGSLGLHTPFGRFLFDYVPLFSGIRVPARWAMIVYLGIAMLASYGAFALARTRWIYTVILALLFVELRAAPIRWYLATGETPPVYTWLAQQEFRGGVLELPTDQPNVYRTMFWSHVHHKPLINGVSGFRPPTHVAVEQNWRHTPVPPAILIVHGEQPDGPTSLVRFAAFGDDVVYASNDTAQSLTPPAPQPPSIDAALLHPVHWEELTGPLEVRGRISSAQKVILHFDNHRTRFKAEIRAGEFVRTFAARPRSVRADTDLQVEIIDERGNRKLLPQVWLRWRRPGERLHRLLPQTADLGPYLVHPRHEDKTTRPRM